MCLMLYVATVGDQPCFESDLLNIEDVEPEHEAVQGDESQPPLGTIDKGIDAVQPETWFFIEGFLYRVSAGPG